MGKGSGGGSGASKYHLRGGHAPLPEEEGLRRLRRENTNSPSSSSHTRKLSTASPGHNTHHPNVPKGFLNIGNSCYANAVLQCLLSTALVPVLMDPKASAIFRRYSSNPRLLAQGSGSVDSSSDCCGTADGSSSLLSQQQRSTRTESSGLHQSQRLQENCAWLTRELRSITLQYQDTRSSSSMRQSSFDLSHWLSLSSQRSASTVVLDPGSLTKHPHRLSNCLRPYQQEDAHEFLRALLSTLVMHGQHKQLSSLFDGLLESAVTCLTCRRPSLTRDRYMDLSLDICHDSIGSLQDALEDFTATETLSGDNRVFCTKCDCKRNASKGLRLATAPSILVVHFKRFALDEYGRLVRLSKLVEFPLRLEIADYMSRVNKARPPPYELVAVLVHQGRSCESGHYVAFTRHAGQWYKCNDAQVERVSVETVLRQQAYILVYEVADMRSQHGYASPSGGCTGKASNSKACGSGAKRTATGADSTAADPKGDFCKLLSSSLCGLDDLVLQDFCWDVSNGMCQKESMASSPMRQQRRRRPREEPQAHYHSTYRSSDMSATLDAHDDLSTLGESTVDTADTSKVPFRRACSSGNLKSLERARDKISHSTGRPTQRFFGPDCNDERNATQDSNGAAVLPDYKTAKRWAEARKAAANTTTTNPRQDKAGSTPRRLPPRPKAPSRSHRRAISQGAYGCDDDDGIQVYESDFEVTADEVSAFTGGYDD